MLWLLYFLGCLGIAGAGVTARLLDADRERPDVTLGPIEAAAASVILAFFLGIALNWGLAPFHAIGRWTLLAGATVLALTGLAPLRRARARIVAGARAVAAADGMGLVGWVAVLAPLATWLVFAVWRGTLTPILNHDALSYHLPRALDIARTGTWHVLDVEDFRLASFPASYEMLLADVILLTGGDQATSLVGVLTYAAGVLVACAFAERRWGSGPLAWLTALVWAGTPLTLLQSVGHKSDTLEAVATVGVALWGARWAAEGGRTPLVLATLSAAVAIGVKATGVPLVAAALVGLAPFGLVARARAALRHPRAALGWVALAVAALALCGVVTYVTQWLRVGDPRLILQPDDPAAFATNMAPRYGAWSNLPTFLALAWLEPFSSDPKHVWVPWRHEAWTWPRYELYFSSFGALVSVLAVVAVVVLVAGPRRGRPGLPSLASLAGPAERRGAAAAFVVLVVLVINLRYHCDGIYVATCRYVMFVPLVVVEWGAARWLASLQRDALRVRLGQVALVVAGGVMVREGIDSALNDRFAPLSYLGFVVEHPGMRQSAFGQVRGETVVDTFAGPADRVFIDAGFGAWVYLAYGADLSRQVEIASPTPALRDEQIARADWVVVDRYWGVAWGSPGLTDLGKFDEYIDKGAADPRELGVLDALLVDPRFEFVYHDRAMHQLVLHRRSP